LSNTNLGAAPSGRKSELGVFSVKFPLSKFPLSWAKI
jgi:hypothetical protein